MFRLLLWLVVFVVGMDVKATDDVQKTFYVARSGDSNRTREAAIGVVNLTGATSFEGILHYSTLSGSAYKVSATLVPDQVNPDIKVGWGKMVVPYGPQFSSYISLDQREHFICKYDVYIQIKEQSKEGRLDISLYLPRIAVYAVDPSDCNGSSYAWYSDKLFKK